MLIDRIKDDQLQARKDRDKVIASLLTTLLGEAQMIGKNDGNRDSTDNEVIAVIKKFVKNLKELLKVTESDSKEEQLALYEIDVLEEYLPTQLSKNEIILEVTTIILELMEDPNMGQVMKAMKEKFNGNYDGRVVSEVVKELLN